MWPADPLEVYLHDLALLSTVRAEVAVAVDEWGYADPDAVVLVVNELAANGIDHGAGPVRIAVSSTGSGVRVEVSDAGSGHPEVRTTGFEEERGRGLQVVSDLAQGWGFEDRPSGTTVWAVLDEPAPLVAA